jgi:hypothetical protein
VSTDQSRFARIEAALCALAIALSAAFIAIRCFRPSGTIDLWWTLQVGDYVRQTGTVPRTALWTIEAVRDTPYVCPSWLAAVAFSGVRAAFGLDAIPALPTLIAAVVFGFMIAVGRQVGASLLLALCAADALLYLVTWRMVCRAEVFGYLYFAIALWMIARFVRTGRIRDLAWLAPIAVLWANSHGSFPLLPAVLVLVAIGRSLDAWCRAGFRTGALGASFLSRTTAALAGAAAVAVLAALVNPYGLDLVHSVAEPARANSMTLHIAEWEPLYVAGAPLPDFVVPASVIGVAIVAAIAIGFRRLSFVSMLLAVAAVALALSARRHITVAGIGVTWLLAEFAAGHAIGPRVRTAIALALVASLVAANVRSARELSYVDRSLTSNPSDYITARGLEYVREHVRGNVLNSYHLGSVLTYFGYPQLRVAIDSRAEPFPPEYVDAYRAAMYGGDPETTWAFVRRYSFDHIVVGMQGVSPWLSSVPDFQPVYWDPLIAVFSRIPPPAPAPQ